MIPIQTNANRLYFVTYTPKGETQEHLQGYVLYAYTAEDAYTQFRIQFPERYYTIQEIRPCERVPGNYVNRNGEWMSLQ